MDENIREASRESANTVLKRQITQLEHRLTQLRKLEKLTSSPGFDPDLESFLWDLLLHHQHPRSLY